MDYSIIAAAVVSVPMASYSALVLRVALTREEGDIGYQLQPGCVQPTVVAVLPKDKPQYPLVVDDARMVAGAPL